MKLSFNIKKRIFTILVVNTIIPILIIALVSIVNYNSLLDYQIASFSTSIVNNSKDRMDDMLAEIDRVAQTFVFQQTSVGNNVLSTINRQPGSVNSYDSDFLEDNRKIDFIIQSFLYSHSYINGIYIFTKDGRTFSYSKGYDLKNNYNPKGDAWYEKTLAGKGKLISSDVKVQDFLMSSEPSILFSTVFYDQNTLQEQGVTLIDCNLSIFSNIIKNIPPEQGTIFLLDDQGKYIYHPDKTKINTFADAYILEKTSSQDKVVSYNALQNNYLLFDTLSEKNWKIVATFSVSQLGSTFKHTLSFTVLVIILCILLSFFISNLFSNTFSKPIIRLANLMKSWNESKSFNPNAKYSKRTDEVGILYRYFNMMIEKIDTLIKDKYQTQLIVMDAEMKALESQINSHFLYNTLESINSIAEIEGIDSISIMTKALGDMFRYSIKTDSELVYLEEELKHINDYLVIQKIRYNNKINAEFNIQQDLLKSKILKLILQPIVENAICHGLEYKKGKGMLKISAYSDESSIIFEIYDDGIGIPVEQLSNLQKVLQEPPQFEKLGRRDKRGIGIVNVNARIKLYYGEEYGLKVSSEQNVGSIIQIKVPKLQEG